MAKAWLVLGANIGDPLAQLEEAVARLDAMPTLAVTKRSSVLLTKPWGKTDQNDFHNMALEVETESTPQELLAICLGVEAAMGRQRLERWGPRLIDIDIIAYERQVIDEPNLKVPHPFAHERDFVLVPLREIAPDVADWLVTRRY
ncbi:2-amino-4-hydroxy-6-hydroxymethyldihydropteridine diphosphokinase [Paradevosia shaoguanensis]|uniref:2-amino-4-hydroxy-6- hydroxymethyldihydropteridine diphosphokinase n=1 Tax=Paradevosia shaoguanensis TaxID=1335043 RepID=UPI0019343AF9|nr:2-amino-4-hydroxy-6-hydroxymethyldihydropteridine diphosphokinase [Paradevosia shaoguanensis]